ncbi:LOW QUALITY PROTEIN: hypothetical protein IFM46972_04621 [Aspergillus udagawae]|uniref:Uncharacterized protein n=1 Tax=Aspergillus udagawae TaxID=91492 RepID=A0A8H3RRV5_9EURO|nr:LOW QUALITY PROTEIN: hypothetical protein IFM46972_04621 [Aspergillus udagawae]
MPKSGPDDSIVAGLQHLQVILPITHTLSRDLNLRHSLCLSYLESLSSMETSDIDTLPQGGKIAKDLCYELSSIPSIYIKHHTNSHLNPIVILSIAYLEFSKHSLSINYAATAKQILPSEHYQSKQIQNTNHPSPQRS